jgi:cbb3-type cytochrome oxidase maturation protein
MSDYSVFFYTFCIAISMSLGALAIFIWTVLSGQWEDVEESKYRFLERELSDE